MLRGKSDTAAPAEASEVKKAVSLQVIIRRQSIEKARISLIITPHFRPSLTPDTYPPDP